MAGETRPHLPPLTARHWVGLTETVHQWKQTRLILTTHVCCSDQLWVCARWKRPVAYFPLVPTTAHSMSHRE